MWQGVPSAPSSTRWAKDFSLSRIQKCYRRYTVFQKHGARIIQEAKQCSPLQLSKVTMHGTAQRRHLMCALYSERYRVRRAGTDSRSFWHSSLLSRGRYVLNTSCKTTQGTISFFISKASTIGESTFTFFLFFARIYLRDALAGKSNTFGTFHDFLCIALRAMHCWVRQCLIFLQTYLTSPCGVMNQMPVACTFAMAELPVL